MFVVLNFLFTDFVYPTGTVDFITIVASGFISSTSLITTSTKEVLK